LIAVAIAASACTLPADDAGEIPVDERLDGPVTEPEVSALDEPYEPELTYAECVQACYAGVEAIERFCRRIPNPVIVARCLAIRYGGPILCSNWCAWYFLPH
jgi:hypothetical protein